MQQVGRSCKVHKYWCQLSTNGIYKQLGILYRLKFTWVNCSWHYATSKKDYTSMLSPLLLSRALCKLTTIVIIVIHYHYHQRRMVVILRPPSFYFQCEGEETFPNTVHCCYPFYGQHPWRKRESL